MNCKSCSLNFNNNLNLPRFLPKCGHTICNKCVMAIFDAGELVCPECQTISFAELVSDFPKNQTVLDFIDKAEAIGSLSEPTEERGIPNDLVSIEGSFLNDLNTQLTSNKNEDKKNKYDCSSHSENKCIVHRKQFEAFCIDDKQLLCVQCLLEKQHNNHTAYDIDTGFDKANSRFIKKKDEYESKNAFLFENYKDNLNGILDEITNQFKFSSSKVDIMFNELIDIISKRKKEVLSELR